MSLEIAPNLARTTLGYDSSSEDPSLIRPELLHELFEAQVDACPNRVAVEFDGDRLTYAEIERRANQLARYIRAAGAGRGSVVGILLNRSMEVYVAMLAVMKAGAAYVPMDPEYPPDRVAYILRDSGASMLISESEFASHLLPDGPEVVLLDAQVEDLIAQSPARLSRAEIGTEPHDLCYLIYTSGSTGHPKGVQIEHRSICHLVRAEAKLFAITPSDRVYQGFSCAFDASLEEIWMAFFSGATLIAATTDVAHAASDLPKILNQLGVTVMSCVPTMLALMDEDIASLRILIVGGEACPPYLVEKWCGPGRRMFNTYGPTEATVIATCGELSPSRAVTIGRAVPNYKIVLLDERGNHVPPGTVGEIYIGGVGLARGYVGRPDLTAERFLTNPISGDPGDRLYKSGDLGRLTRDGEIEILGRADTQVKIRGFRVELSEVESELMRCEGVRASVVDLREDAPGIKQLVGYVVTRDDAPLDEDAMKTRLRVDLPPYMIPAAIERIAKIPKLPSGKINRKALPAPAPRKVAGHGEYHAPRNDLELKLAEEWGRLAGATKVSRDADFFSSDIGGHSLLAARMVSELRRDLDFHTLSVIDVYHHSTLSGLAAEIERRRNLPTLESVGRDSSASTDRSHLAHRLCALAQVPALYLVFFVVSMQWLIPYLTYSRMAASHAVMVSMSTALGMLLLLYPAELILTIAVKWLILGRIEAGAYPLWSSYYFRWWLVDRMLSLTHIDALAGTPLINLYYRAMGARIGAGVHIGAHCTTMFDMLTVGDDSSIGVETGLAGYTVEDGWLKIAPITVGQRCFIGARAMMRPNSTMEDDASLGDLSMLPEGAAIARGQSWAGSPARPLVTRENHAEHRTAAIVRPSSARHAAFALLHAIGALLLPSVYLVALLPGIAVLWSVSEHVALGTGLLRIAAASPLVALSFIVLLCLEIVAIKWLLLGRVKPGTYRIDSWLYVRKWFVDQLMEVSLDFLGPLYATLYLNPWYKLLGARIGAKAEISTACSASPDLIELGDESFVADAVSLGTPRIEGGYITLAKTEIGRRAFIGNSALIPAGATIGQGTLIGVLSSTPLGGHGAEQAATSWLGTPAIFLPKRHEAQTASDEQTYQPSRKLVTLRLAIEFLRITLPATFLTMLSGVLITVAVMTFSRMVALEAVLLFPLVMFGCGIAAALIVIAAKWLLMGRYRPGEAMLWSGFVWRNELVTAMHENLADPFLTDYLLGTPYAGWFFRLLGSKIGRRVFLNSTCFTEYDLIKIGDDVAVNSDCTLQTHLFEDRVMKMSTVNIGDQCSLGAGSVVLYDTLLKPGANLSDLSLVMKGEVLPPDTLWEGSPCRRSPERESPLAPSKLLASLEIESKATGVRVGRHLSDISGVAAGAR